LRENYEFRLRYDEAGKFFIREMELKRRYREVISEGWESYNFPGYLIRHQNGMGRIDSNVTPTEDSQWRMVPGLAGQGVSFQSVNFPSNYLRHSINGEIRLNEIDYSSQLFRGDATFNMRPGLADATKVSFESYNYPGNFIRHRNSLLYSEQVPDEIFASGSILRPEHNDATFSSPKFRTSQYTGVSIFSYPGETYGTLMTP